MQETVLRILHCLNEINLRNQWRDDDRFCIRLSRQLAGATPPESETQFLHRIQKTKTHFFQGNRVSKKHYSEYVWPYVTQVLDSVRIHSMSYEDTAIVSEETLFRVVTGVLNEYKRGIESTRLWQPFWNEENRKPQTPKAETSLQPTIFSQLRPTFRHRGIELLREPNDGAGPLDFRCTSIHNSTVFNCCIEFKRAQHGQLEHKLQTQLPAYMDAAVTRHGVFFVFWFKDDVFYRKPTTYSSPHALRLTLLDAAKSVAPRVIEVIVVDVTPKPPASRK